ncbi:PREDICTED: uncharacterized protein LOC106740678 [Dinoponera quadriceps]|uniref:Uncharacterized protein LOC106740678 n=1 Tax=Dinoponera quadriceps TaxID=609295 RepID=A0A6P3WNK9_DINQU|nr:PREDICTED: uncharacterized protein LOC106740678 [Dinoponera quadriceps]
MLFRWFCASLLILAIQDVVAAGIDHIDLAQFNMVYYNLATQTGLKGELENTGRHPLTNARISFRGLGCNCLGLTCACCTGINLTAINFNRRTCTNFTYDPDEFSIKVAIMMNEREVFAYSLSAKNPPPLCVPFSYLPIINFCVRFFDIYTPGSNLHACIDFETRVVNWPILVLHFNCVKIGLDGISWTKPQDGSNAVLQAQSEASEPEVYDDVDFEHDPVFPNNHTSGLTPEEEANIGQLKL